MNQKIRLLEGDCDLNDDAEPEYDFAAIREQAKAEGREYQGILSAGLVVRIPPHLAAFFKTPEAVNEALQRVMDSFSEEQKAA